MRWPWQRRTQNRRPLVTQTSEVPDRLIELVGRVHEAAGILQELLEDLREEMEREGLARGN